MYVAVYALIDFVAVVVVVVIINVFVSVINTVAEVYEEMISQGVVDVTTEQTTIQNETRKANNNITLTNAIPTKMVDVERKTIIAMRTTTNKITQILNTRITVKTINLPNEFQREI